MASARGYVGVVGPSGAIDASLSQAAEQVGHQLASAGAVVVTGGGTGVMEAASRGAVRAGGMALGILPGADRREANPHLTLSLPTGLGEVRNALLVRSVDVLVAVGGSWGTLSEIALACRTGVPVYALGGWQLPDDGPVVVADAQEAAVRALTHLATA
jgi:hypothetical protein